MTAAVCSRRFSCGRQPIHPSGQHRLDRRWHLDVLQGFGQTVGAPSTDQDVRLDQGLHAFLQEKWIALGALQQTLHQRHEADVVSQ